MRVFIAAILAGLIPASPKAVEPSVNNNQQVILAKTVDDATSVPTSTERRQPSHLPSGTTGGRRTPPPHANPYTNNFFRIKIPNSFDSVLLPQ